MKANSFHVFSPLALLCMNVLLRETISKSYIKSNNNTFLSSILYLGVISWKIPSQTVRVRDPLVRSVITPELLQKHLNLHYLHPDVASMLNPTLISCLGIETLTSEHLFHLGKALVADMNGHCGMFLYDFVFSFRSFMLFFQGF